MGTLRFRLFVGFKSLGLGVRESIALLGCGHPAIPPGPYRRRQRSLLGRKRGVHADPCRVQAPGVLFVPAGVGPSTSSSENSGWPSRARRKWNPRFGKSSRMAARRQPPAELDKIGLQSSFASWHRVRP